MQRILTFAAAAILALAATAVNAPPVTAADAATHVSVTITEMAITLSAPTAPAGAVIFDVTNAGAVEHEFVVLKTAIAEDALPPNEEEEGKVAEVGNVGEVDPVMPGETVSLAVTVRPGSYVLICNKPGHYAAGMHVGFTVTTPVAATVKEMSIGLSQAYATGGLVTFTVANSGTVVHEFVVLKTDIAEGALAASTDEPFTVEEPGSVGEVEDIDPGTTKSLTLTLDPGKYVIICNEPGHYAGGMHTSFTVLPTQSTAEAAAVDQALIELGIEDLEDADARVDTDALLAAPGIVVTANDRAAIAAGIVPRAVDATGALVY